MGFYIFNASAIETFESKRVASVEVIKYRLDKKKWPLYSGTANRKRLEVGDSIVFYAAGYQVSSQHFIGAARVSGIRLYDGLRIDNDDWLTDIPDFIVELDNIEIFEQPVSIRERLSKLSFILNKKSWGNSLQGGTRLISEKDFIQCIP